MNLRRFLTSLSKNCITSEICKRKAACARPLKKAKILNTIALVAHDQKKSDMVDFVKDHAKILSTATIITTGTTGLRIKEAVESLNITPVKSGPLGGDQQIGGMIADAEIDVLIFFIDPLTAMPHDVDVKALLRLCALYNIPTAINRQTAEIVIASIKKGR